VIDLVSADDFSEKFDVSRETMGRLQAYAALVEKWNPRINLVSKRSLESLWERHIADSAQLYIHGKTSGRWLDIGSGGGFPGIVAAIMSAEKSPNVSFCLIESDQRKSAFLRAALRETGVAGEVVTERVEKVPSVGAQTLSARALAPLNKLLEYAQQHLHADGTALFPKGANYRDEMVEARKKWNFELEEIQSTTDTDAVILKIGAIEHV
jgi:16S rRNA (guanine527-N7)-methyltransferase